MCLYVLYKTSAGVNIDPMGQTFNKKKIIIDHVHDCFHFVTPTIAPFNLTFPGVDFIKFKSWVKDYWQSMPNIYR